MSTRVWFQLYLKQGLCFCLHKLVVQIKVSSALNNGIPYSIKLWQEKTLADLAVHGHPAKVLSAKKLSGLVSSNIEWALPLSTAKVFSANILVVQIPPKFSPAKVLCYTVSFIFLYPSYVPLCIIYKRHIPYNM